jgi:hypothetical protein
MAPQDARTVDTNDATAALQKIPQGRGRDLFCFLASPQGSQYKSGVKS